MKNIKKLLLVITTITLIITLSSCASNNRNTSVPMGSIDTSSIVASTGEHQLTNGEYYSRLRANGGYDTFLAQLQKTLFADEYATILTEINLTDSNVTDTEQTIFDSISSSIFSTSVGKDVEKIKATEMNKMIQRFIDNQSNQGITVTAEQCKSYTIVDDKVQFSNMPMDIIENYTLNVAMQRATKVALESIVNNEKIEDEDGKLVTNTNYIDEDDIQSYYESNMRDYGTYSAIIVQFNNLTEARNAVKAAELAAGALTSTSDNAERFYSVLYNSYYNYREELDVTDPFSSSQTKYIVNAKKDDLTDISSSIKTFVTETLEDGEFLTTPFNLNNKYIMVYRGSTIYEVNEKYNTSSKNEVIEWENLLEEVKTQQNYDEIYAEIKDKLIDNKISSYTSTVLNERIEEATISIYDPLFEYRFKNSYSDDYDLIDKFDFNNDYIFTCTYNNKTTNYSVTDFYNKQTKSKGLTTVIERLQLDYVYDLKDLFLDKDAIDSLEDTIDKAIKNFNDNKNSSYPASLGLETFLLSSYGYSTRDEVIKYSQVATSALSSYLSQTVFDEWATDDHKINTEKLNILQNLLDAGNANYSNLFSINIDHILIYIDDNADGTPDDPADFINKLSAAEQAEFNSALLRLSQAIYAEANCTELTQSNDIMEILNYIVKAYSRNDKLYSNPETTWATYKKYNFLLKVESLSSSGDTNQSNVSNYVTEFGDYVKALYKKAVADDIKIEEDESIFLFASSGTEAPASMDDICATEFGYHMIVVNSYDLPDETKKSESDDRYGYQKDFEVLLNEKDTDTEDDNIYVVVENTYNELTTEATMNQLFTYYVQSQNNLTSTLDSSIQTLFSSMFGDAISRYTSSDFQKYLLFVDMNIQTTNSTLQNQLKNYKGYLQRTSQSYKDDDAFDSWYSSSINWSRPYTK